jgi:chemosensory pili system protein ChpA (sensor histidine kinase/response regulator)
MNTHPRPQLANGLRWVRGELEQSIGRARGLIEQHVENGDDPLPLQQALNELHQVRGTAAMIQCHGAVALSEEMKAGLQDLMHGRVQDSEPLYAALLGCTIQLNDYLLALADGSEDCVLVLQPAINELRLTRGQPVLTESELFVAQLQGLQLALPLPERRAAADVTAQQQAQQLLSLFQVSLLSWIRSAPDASKAAGRLGKIAEQLALHAQSVEVHQLWRVVAAAVEALLTRAIDESMDFKRLLGRASAQIKLLAEQGEDAAAASSQELSLQLLFLLGRSRAQGLRVQALRQAFLLSSYLPTAAQIDENRRKIHGPSTSLLNRVSEEIRSEFAKVKDRIDLAVRTGGAAASSDPGFADTRASLKRIADTLSVLGLTVLQRVVGNQAAALENLGENPPPSAWMEIATSILRVENSLENALFFQLRRPRAVDQRDELEVEIPASRDLSEGVGALYRESLVNLARVKAAVDVYLKSGSSAELPEAALLVDEIASGFDILGSAEAAPLLQRLRQFICGSTFPSLRERPDRAARFADTVTCVEFYIEAVRDALPEAAQALQPLRHHLDQLEAYDRAVVEPEPERSLSPTEEPAALAPDIAAEVESAAEPAAVIEMPPVADSAASAAAGDDDPEIRDIFLEEAEEVRATLEGVLPSWTRDPQNQQALTTLRRAFHTLKGSGRTVGARELGEFGWAIENMLNRCIDGSVPTSAGVVATVVDAVAQLPELITAFRERRVATVPMAELVERAGEYAAGRDPAASADGDMAAIFRDDAQEKLDLVSQWLSGLDRSFPGQRIDSEVKRAFHTLRGAARVVEAPAISEVAGALEAYLDALVEARAPISTDGVQLLDDATATLRTWSAQVGARALQAQQDAAPWLQRIQGLQQHFPTAAPEAGGVDRELAEIFAGEAFDLVQKMEDVLRGWAQTPDNQRAPQELKVISHTLKGAALMAECQAIGNSARALHERMDQSLLDFVAPDAAAFAELMAFSEALYQQLDAYRDGKLDDDGAELVARIQALRWRSDTSLKVAADAPELADAAAAVADEPATAVATESASADEQIIDMPPVASDDEQLPEFELPAVSAHLSDAAPLSAASELAAAAAAFLPPSATEDPELLGIFIAEAEELLEGLDQSTVTLEREVRNVAAMQELKRLLHTFKGSARVAGLAAMGEVAHGMESLLDAVEQGRAAADTAFFARLHNAIDGLHLSLDDLRRGLIPDVSRLLDELADEAATRAPLPIVEAGLPLPAAGDVERVAEPLPVAAPPAAAAPEVDDELVQVFTGEAVELTEQLEQALQRWQQQPADRTAAQDMLRALHTLKGGARVSGMVAMGDAAHALESQLAAQEDAASIDATALTSIATAVAGLRALTDALERAPQRAVTVDDAMAASTEADPAAASEAAAAGAWDPELFWRPSQDGDALVAMRRETARVPVEALDAMLNEAGEISIYRSRLEEHNAAIQAQLDEMAQAIQRVREQLRQLQAETDAQIAARGLNQTEGADRYAGEFDPLEMDRYTRMQELSRTLNESVGDLAAVHASMDELSSEAVTILLQQGRINTDVQQGLMRTLMVPFSRQAARLQRVVHQTALENGKRAEVQFSGIEAELDRNVLERMTAPLEHLLRNAVVHGIEMPDARSYAGKPAAGQISVKLWREGTQLFIELRDDGRGLDFQAIRETAIRRGMMPADAEIGDEEAAQFIFVPGFSTARQLTQDAGRGVGMDVVAAEVKQLGGTLELASEIGKGARFLVRLPLTLALSQTLLVAVGGEQYAVPLPSIEGIARLSREQLDSYYQENGPTFRYGEHDYRVHYLGSLVGVARDPASEPKMLNAILVRLPEGLGTGERRVAMVVDALIGNREIVSKTVGPQVSVIPGINGATILADGRVVLILDVVTLTQDRTRRALRSLAVGEATKVAAAKLGDLVMVIDDSITIRRVTERLLLKNGYRVVMAKDGLDAMAQLQTESPTAILLDIEMPRADGFEVAAFVRNTERIAATPIIMITSRSGDKHRERARALGVNRYLIKPFLEEQLLEDLRAVVDGETA